MRKFLLQIIIIVISSGALFAGNTGKISGKIMDSETGTGLPGVNVIILGTKQGAIADVNGYYVILNVPPGSYTLKASIIGYTNYTVTKVEVNIDRTTTINISMKPEAIQTNEVQIVASRPIVQKDVASSVMNLSDKQVEALPIQNVSQIMGYQAGIQGTTIRGGGQDQTNFMIDGLTLRDERTLNSYTKISLNSLKEIQIQKGGFNAEYGDARSGIVNIVTKEGEVNKYSFAVTTNIKAPGAKHFGISLYDPMSYWNRPFLDPAVCWTGTKSGAWDTYTQAQYPSFDGWNAISNATLQDNDPTNDLTPAAAQRLYMWQHRRQGDIKKTDYNIDAALGGPIPFISEMLGNLRFFAAFRAERNMYLIPLSREEYLDYNGTIKITSDITNKMKLNVSGMYAKTSGTTSNNSGSAGIFSSTEGIANALSRVNYISTRIWVPDYWCPTTQTKTLFGAKFTYILNDKTLAEAQIQQSGTKYDTKPNDLRNISQIYKFGNSYYVDEGPFGYYPYPAPGIGDQSFRMGFGMSNGRDSSEISTLNFNASFTSQFNETNQFKAGVEFIYNDQRVNFGSVELTLPTGNNNYNWERFPIRGSLYIQDKLEFEGLIINGGVRFDYSNPNGEWYDLSDFDILLSNKYGDLLDSKAPKVKTDVQLDISPRLSVSHPITEDSKLYFNYGHFRSMPITSNLYEIDKAWDKAISFLANPNLLLSKTIQYELGYDHNLFDMFLLQISAYYKDVSDEPRLVSYVSADGKVNYSTSKNNRYADIRGFEITLRKDRGEWLNGFINYTYMATLAGWFDYSRIYENPADMRNWIRQMSDAKPDKPIPMPYARANLEFRTPSDFGPDFAGIMPLSSWRISFLPEWRSGSYFTWGNVPGLVYNLQWKDYYMVNLRVMKDFTFGKFNIQLIMDVNNLFSFKNFAVPGYDSFNFGFYDYNDFKAYMESLRLPKELADKMGAPYNTRYGNDKPGDVRDENTLYDPNSTDETTKAYIDMPNQTSLTFLNPRNIFWGIRLNFDF